MTNKNISLLWIYIYIRHMLFSIYRQVKLTHLHAWTFPITKCLSAHSTINDVFFFALNVHHRQRLQKSHQLMLRQQQLQYSGAWVCRKKNENYCCSVINTNLSLLSREASFDSLESNWIESRRGRAMTRRFFFTFPFLTHSRWVGIVI